jgi:A/G-specific adenine glycosylase
MPRARTNSKPPPSPGRGTTNGTQDPKLGILVSLQLEWFTRNARDLPWRRTRDPYAIWVSEIMLQQTQVKTVIPFWNRWMLALPTIEALANASSETIHKLWEGLGYYTRVRNMQKAAQYIVANHSGRFPAQFNDLLALPGIGRYTAGAICSIAFNQTTPILDGNVIRVLTRVFAISGNPRGKETNARLWRIAQELVTRAKHARFAKERKASPPLRLSRSLREATCCSFLNQSLMELGALICTPRAPQCPACPVAKHCLAFQQNRVEEFPAPGKRAEITGRRFAAFVFERNGSFLVRQRPADVVNGHLWEFPNVELSQAGAEVALLAKGILGFKPKTLRSLCIIRHSITRYRISLEAFAVNGIQSARVNANSGRWLPFAELQKLSFPSAHRKILDRIGKMNS